MELHPYLFCLFFCLLYFFLPLFEDNGLLSEPDGFALVGQESKGREGALSQEGSPIPGKGVLREVSKHQETLSLLNLWRALETQRAT